ncbi:MAG: hypothetical protein ABWY23_03230 [Mycetocola sp.]
MRKTNRQGLIALVAAVTAFTAVGLGQAGVNEWWAIALMVVSIIVLGVLRAIDSARQLTPPPPSTKPPGERRRRVAQLRREEQRRLD